jgi:hypothetical protein
MRRQPKCGMRKGQGGGFRLIEFGRIIMRRGGRCRFLIHWVSGAGKPGLSFGHMFSLKGSTHRFIVVYLQPVRLWVVLMTRLSSVVD